MFQSVADIRQNTNMRYVSGPAKRGRSCRKKYRNDDDDKSDSGCLSRVSKWTTSNGSSNRNNSNNNSSKSVCSISQPPMTPAFFQASPVNNPSKNLYFRYQTVPFTSTFFPSLQQSLPSNHLLIYPSANYTAPPTSALSVINSVLVRLSC